MRNILIASVIAVTLVVGASQPVLAQSADVQAQIKSLQQQIQALMQQLSALRGYAGNETTTGSGTAVAQQVIGHRFCAIMGRNLAQASQGDDVRALQEFLQSEGYLSANATGYFGSLTRDALARWQSRNGMEGAGMVGPKTLAYLKQRCGLATGGALFASPTSGSAPLTVSFTSQIGDGMTRPSAYDGQDTVIDFGDGSATQWVSCLSGSNGMGERCPSPAKFSHTYSQNGTYIATLKKTGGFCVGACPETVVSQVKITVGATQPGMCTKEYMPVCGAKPITCITTPCNPIPTTYSNRCMMNADGASYLYDGSCKATGTNPADDAQCKSWYDGCNSCSRSTPGGMAACTLKYCAVPEKAYCTAYFDSTTNRPPTVSGLSGPTTLAVGESGTWKIEAADPENGSLSYSVNWGESTPYLSSSAVGSSAQFQQTTSFSHSYANAGTYTVSVIVTDNVGGSAKAATTVKVGSAPTVCTMQYDPVCARPSGCANTCAPGMACPAICQLKEPKTYGNRCSADAEGAQFIHSGQCTSTSGNWY